MAESVVRFVVEKLGDAFVKEVLHLYGVSEQVEKVGRELSWIQAFLKDADRKRFVNERQKQWVKDVRDLAYWIEDVIDTFLITIPEKKPGKREAVKRLFTKTKKIPAVHRLGDEINKIEERIQEIKACRDMYGITNLAEGVEGEIIGQPARPIVVPDIDEAGLVGFEKERDEIVGLLLDKSTKMRSVISIVGTGGLGKTTLARKVYNSEDVKIEFNIHVWVVISQKFEPIDIVQKIAEQLHIEPPKDLSGHRLIELCQFLKEKRYLIVLDDIWTDDLWTQIGGIFPDENNGSRILITTRISNVVNEANSTQYKLQFLSEEQSLELFMKKALPHQNANERYPDDLYNIGKQFAKKCGGLPLALVVLGGLLLRRPPTYFEWSGMMQKMDWGIEGNKCLAILDTSYEDLPFALKSCFMYFAAFPEDYEIEAISLLWMWIAEGFVPQEKNRTLEDTAASFLEDLVQRSMVLVSRRDLDGYITRCRIHDLLHGLAIIKAKDDNFLMACSKIDEMQNCGQTRRLAMHEVNDTWLPEIDNSMSRFVTPNLRSLICCKSRLMPKVSPLMHLKVLSRDGNPNQYEPTKFGRLNQLRYFQVGLKVYTKDVDSFHRFIGGMRFLQTLDLQGCEIPCELPDCVWHVKTLRHVLMKRHAGPPPSVDLINLQTLEGVRNRESWKTKGLPKLPNLKCFSIEVRNIERDTFTTLLCMLEHLTSLGIDGEDVPFNILDMREFPFYDRLQKLWIWGKCHKKTALDVGMMPIHLTQLMLDIFNEGDPMPVLEKLKNLRRLELRGSGFKKICCSDAGFVKLESLRIYLGELEEWEIEKGALPKLKDLRIGNCKVLSVPLGLQHLTVLQDLKWINHYESAPATRREDEDLIRSLCKHIPKISIHL